MKPQRMQRKRHKGYNMQQESRAINGLDAVYVGRPTKWGNPFRPLVKNPSLADYTGCRRDYLFWLSGKKTGNQIHDFYCRTMTLNLTWQRVAIIDCIPELRGKNLCCYCPLDQPCHADVLLELANKEAEK